MKIGEESVLYDEDGNKRVGKVVYIKPNGAPIIEPDNLFEEWGYLNKGIDIKERFSDFDGDDNKMYLNMLSNEWEELF